jgi:PAS domain S-box-containing protein
MHSLLQRQLKRHFGDPSCIPTEWQSFLQSVNEAYQGFDADRAMLERSLELSSQELLDANSEMRAVFDAIPDLVFRINRDGVILKVKAGNANDLMSRREDLIGKRIQDTPLKNIARQFSETIQRVILESAPVSFEYSAVLQGQESHYEARLVPLPDQQIAVIIHNITERKQSLRLLGSAVEQTTESIMITDAELDLPGPRIIFVNPAFTKMTGYTAAEVLGKTPRLLQGPKSDRAVLRRLRETLNREETFAGESVNYRKDGTEFNMEWQVAPIRDTGGKTTHFVGIQRDITARKQTEAALRASEAEFRILAEAMPQIVWITRPDGWNIYFNQRWMDYTGLTLEESLGEGWNKPFHPDDQQRAWDAWQEAVATTGDYSLECRLRRADGVYRWWLIRGAPLQDDTGNLIKWFGTCTDIHDLKEAEQSLRLFGSAVKQATESIMITDAELDLPGPRIIFVNPAFTQMTGYTAAEVLGKTPRLLQGPKSDRAVLRRLRETLNREETFAGEIINYRKNGTEYNLEWEIAPIHNASGITTHFVSVQRDITKRKQAEAALRESETRYRALFDGSADGIVIADVETKKIKYANPALCRMLGYTEAELCNLGVADVHPPESLPQVVAEFEAQARGEKTLAADLPCLRKDGSVFPADISTTAMTIDGRPCNLGFFRDITGRKRLEEQLRASEKRLNEAQRMAQIGSWVWQPDGNFWSETMFHLHGIPWQDAAPAFERFLAAVHPDDRERVSTHFQELLASNRDSDETEYRVLLPDGVLRTIAVIGHLERDASGRTIRVVGTSQDITKRKQTEAELRMFQFASDNAVDEIFWMNQNAGFYYVNDQACRSLGYTREELMRLNLFDIDPVFPKERWEETWEKMENGQIETFRAESCHRRKDGAVFPIEVMAKHICLSNNLKLLLAVTRDMTERKRMEADLTYERDLLRTLLDQSPDKIYFKDTQSRFIKAGMAHARLFGVASPEDLLGKTDFDFFTEEHARPAFADEQKITRTGVPVIGKVEKEVWQDGREDTWVLTTKMPFHDKDGKIIGTFGVSKDITALKKIENALAYERDLFEMLMDQSPDSIYFKDRQSRFVRFSQAKVKRGFAAELARHTAAHPDEQEENRPAHLASEERFAEYLVGKTDFDLFSEAHARPAFEDEQEIIRTGVPVVGKVEKEIWLDGRETWVLTSKMPFRNNDGQIVGTFGVSKDITEFKEAEAQLRQLSRAVEQSPACIVITDPAGNIAYVNPKFTAVTGYSFAEALGKNPRILKSGETPAAAYTELWQTITAGKEWHGVFHNKKKNGELYWEMASISPIFDATGKITHFLAVKEDVTERKRLEEQLFQSQKMETIGKLAGGVAHEFNSILTAIIGQSELLIEDLPAGDPLAQNAAEIHKAADRAATLTRQLLAYGRKQFLRPEALELNQVLASMDGMLRHLMGGETVEVKIIPAIGLHTVKADAGQIEQVIMNLALNARAAMPNGGKLTLETANVTVDKESVGRYPELPPGEYALLAITDTGTGMSPEVKARVFEPFFTTKDVGKGPGLGLSTCYGIIKQSGGHISVYSELGRGTTFKIYLPQISTANQSQPPPPKSSALPGGTETILLVEDDPALCEMAATLLRRLGYNVLTAANGVEALGVKQQSTTGHIDLLFTDVVMPHMSGKELSDRVRALYPHTRILFTSAYTENASIQQGVLNDGMAFLQKPFTPTALACKVREVLDLPKP